MPPSSNLSHSLGLYELPPTRISITMLIFLVFLRSKLTFHLLLAPFLLLSHHLSSSLLPFACYFYSMCYFWSCCVNLISTLFSMSSQKLSLYLSLCILLIHTLFDTTVLSSCCLYYFLSRSQLSAFSDHPQYLFSLTVRNIIQKVIYVYYRSFPWNYT